MEKFLLQYAITVNRLDVKNEEKRVKGLKKKKNVDRKTRKQGLSLQIYEGWGCQYFKDMNVN